MINLFYRYTDAGGFIAARRFFPLHAAGWRLFGCQFKHWWGGYFWRDFYCFKGNLIGFNHKTEYRCDVIFGDVAR
ncbi:Uncharacterised protein [Shigella sonnei]|nr:Uncharacterised protein [Shigella sonnei]CSF60736.1 Uncharacterised protein [Shigella sonnei]CSG37063.1 Uncharacterised protein [Shigella sonnei]CSH94437.1 Uncharacterised protein [Shigella sonnei]CSP91265.1 Uncharacterised protein [Shigella sonnei]